MKPYLRDKIPQSLSEIPDAPSYEAGYLSQKMPVGATKNLL